MLGELGFNAFVVDVYGKGIRPSTPESCHLSRYAMTGLSRAYPRRKDLALMNTAILANAGHKEHPAYGPLYGACARSVLLAPDSPDAHGCTRRTRWIHRSWHRRPHRAWGHPVVQPWTVCVVVGRR